MTWTCWSRSRGGPQKHFSWGQAERVGAVQPGEEKALGIPYSSLLVLKGDLYKR